MPHVGKYVPWLLKNQVVVGGSSDTFYRPPSRKVTLNFNALGNTGSYPVSWAGMTVVSTVGDYDSTDSTITTYTAVNPTDTAKTIECRFQFRTVAPTPTSAVQYLFDVWLIARDGVTVVAETYEPFQWDRVFVRPSYLFQTGPAWDSSVGLPVFQNFVVRLRASTWAEQPEYHPYRH